VEHISVDLVQCTLEETAVDCRVQPRQKLWGTRSLITLCICYVRLDVINGKWCGLT